MILAANDVGLLGAWFDGQRHFGGPQAHWVNDPAHALLRQAGEQLDAWFARERTRFELPLAPVGTAFQQAVWQALARIDFGVTQAYGQVAQAIGRPSASRAVGAATGRNPWSIIVPCHRLLGQAGALTGYAGGLDRKQALLAFEGSDSLPIVRRAA
jgi:methylated-DNA-[protein]-cysteine S-methyltransferase